MPRGITGRTHFALIVIGKSAATVEEVLGSCAADPLVAGLRVRSVGIASREDRPAGCRIANIVSSSTGSWENDDDLVEALRRQVEHLWRHVATRNEAGLTPAEFAAVRQLHTDHGSADEVDDEDASPLDALIPDILDITDEPEAQDTERITPPAAAAERAVTRWLASIGWRRQREVVPPAQQAPPPLATGLVYLLVVSEQVAIPDPDLGRLQTAVLAVDEKLATRSACRYQVKLVYGDDTELRGELGEAGRISRRGGRRSVEIDDFTAVLKGVRAALRRDSAVVEAKARAQSLAIARPAVVIFAVDPPIADHGSSEAFRDLVANATVIWVVPRNSEALVSPTFVEGHTVAVLPEHPAVAEDICDFLLATDYLAPAPCGAPGA
jgi:hypothetical protein